MHLEGVGPDFIPIARHALEEDPSRHGPVIVKWSVFGTRKGSLKMAYA
jgi:hypothetical protein